MPRDLVAVTPSGCLYMLLRKRTSPKGQRLVRFSCDSPAPYFAPPFKGSWHIIFTPSSSVSGHQPVVSPVVSAISETTRSAVRVQALALSCRSAASAAAGQSGCTADRGPVALHVALREKRLLGTSCSGRRGSGWCGLRVAPGPLVLCTEGSQQQLMAASPWTAADTAAERAAPQP